MIERLVLGVARARHPFLNRVFGMSAELLARDDGRERSAVDSVERKFFGPTGVRALDHAPFKQACRLAVASAAAKRTLQGPLPRWARITANFLGLGPLLVGLAWSSRGRMAKDRSEVFCFLPAQRYADEARRVLGEATQALAEKRPLVTGRMIRFFARALATEPLLLGYPELLTNALRWLAYYERALVEHRPAVVGNYAEGVSSMPLVTLFCRECGAKSVNLQHGERLVNRQVAFMLFDECHFWSAKYAQVYVDSRSLAERIWLSGSGLHRRLAAEREGWHERPERLLVIHHRIPDMPASYADNLVRLVKALGSSWQLAVRPHPQDGGLWEEIVREIDSAAPGSQTEVEHARDVPLFDSVTRAKLVVGATSSAIIESWIGGAKVVIVPGMAKRESALEPYGGSPNVIWLDESVTDEELAQFLAADRVSDAAEVERVDRVTLISQSEPIIWEARPC